MTPLKVGPRSTVTLTFQPQRHVYHAALTLGRGALIPTRNGSRAYAGPAELKRAEGAQVGQLLHLDAVAVPQDDVPYTLTPDGNASVPSMRVEATDDPVYLRYYLVDQEPEVHPAMQYVIEPPTMQALRFVVSGADVLELVGASGTYSLTLTVTYTDGTRQELRAGLKVDAEAPGGVATYSLAPGFGGYLLYRLVDRDTVRFSVRWEDGSSTEHAARGVPGGIIGIDRPGRPVQVQPIDDSGNVGGNILARIDEPATLNAGGTPLAPWPLPPYIKPDRPRWRPYFRAFAAALDLQPDRAGDGINPTRAEGTDLERVARYFGVYRQPGEDDYDVIENVLERLLPGKSSRAGLKQVISRRAGVSARVYDMLSQYSDLRYLDGSWSLDGSAQLGGRFESLALNPGEAHVILDQTPLIGWPRVLELVARYRAAGIITRISYRKALRTVITPRAGLRVTMSRPRSTQPLSTPLIAARGRIISGKLNLDGTWNLDGRERLNGERRETSIREL